MLKMLALGNVTGQPFAAGFTVRKTKTQYGRSKRHLFAHI